MSRLILFLIVWLGCCAFALARGGAPERIAAAIFLAAALLSLAVEQPQGSRFDSVEVGVLVIDLAVLAGFLILSATANRFWPIWMAAMQGVQVLSHFAIAVNATIIPWAYWNAQTLWSYPMLGLLALATLWHLRRVKACGVDPSWRTSSQRSMRD